MKKNIWGVAVDDLSFSQLICEISQRIYKAQRTTIFTPNSIMIQNAKKDRHFMDVLNSADFNIPDGNGIVLASKLFNSPLCERICGIDLAEALTQTAVEQNLKLFLFGGDEGVADLAAQRLCTLYPTLKICGTRNGFRGNDALCVESVNASGADILYVCLGSPKQELWIHENAPKLPNVKLFMGLGGSLDVWAKKRKLAPYFFRKSGFEWLWRMLSSPQKFKDLPKLINFGFSTLLHALRSMVIMHI